MNSMPEWLKLDICSTRLKTFIDSDEEDVFSIKDCIFCIPEDTYMKEIWKRLSKEKAMDNMRKALQNDAGYQHYQEEIKRELKNIIDSSDDTKTYEKLFSELGQIDDSQASDQDLEDLVKQAVDFKLTNLPQITKENIFKQWDNIVDQDHRRRQN